MPQKRHNHKRLLYIRMFDLWYSISET